MVDKHERGIPDDWEYTIITKIPVGWIVEGTSTLQCLCPYCAYGEGYNEPIIYGQAFPQKKKCKKCGTVFLALSMDAKKTSLWYKYFDKTKRGK